MTVLLLVAGLAFGLLWARGSAVPAVAAPAGEDATPGWARSLQDSVWMMQPVMVGGPVCWMASVLLLADAAVLAGALGLLPFLVALAVTGVALLRSSLVANRDGARVAVMLAATSALLFGLVAGLSWRGVQAMLVA